MKTKFRASIPTFAIVAASLLLLGAGLVAGCSSSPASRIKKNQELFDSLPPQAQASIRAGKVGVGFTPDMVRLALGEPDRLYVRTTERGSAEVWAYASKSFAPSLSFGVGVGGGMGRGVGTGAGIGTTVGGGDRADDRTRVIFEGGKVSAIEQTLPK